MNKYFSNPRLYYRVSWTPLLPNLFLLHQHYFPIYSCILFYSSPHFPRHKFPFITTSTVMVFRLAHYVEYIHISASYPPECHRSVAQYRTLHPGAISQPTCDQEVLNTHSELCNMWFLRLSNVTVRLSEVRFSFCSCLEVYLEGLNVFRVLKTSGFFM